MDRLCALFPDTVKQHDDKHGKARIVLPQASMSGILPPPSRFDGLCAFEFRRRFSRSCHTYHPDYLRLMEALLSSAHHHHKDQLEEALDNLVTWLSRRVDAKQHSASSTTTRSTSALCQRIEAVEAGLQVMHDLVDSLQERLHRCEAKRKRRFVIEDDDDADDDNDPDFEISMDERSLC